MLFRGHKVYLKGRIYVFWGIFGDFFWLSREEDQ